EFIRLACHDKLNVKIITTHGGFVGGDGSLHDALEDLSLMSTLPNLTVLIPSDQIELLEILKYVFFNEGPFYVRLPRASFPKIHDNSYVFKPGIPDIIKQGTDICLIGTGYGSTIGLEAANVLEKELEISIMVINMPCIKPFKENFLINEIKNTSGVIVIEEHNIYCGFGSIIARSLSRKCPKLISCVGVQDLFGQSGKRDDLLKFYGLTVNSIRDQIKSLIK
ncbi:MAG: transketolase family protein, partial [Promethearchaeota archaeon]